MMELGASTLQTFRSVFQRLPNGIQQETLHRLGRRPLWTGGVVPTAPPAADWAETRAPDFVGVGVPKAGTTWWFGLIESHPGVHVANGKELLFFNRTFFANRQATPAGPTGTSQSPAPALDDSTFIDAYRSWFPRPPGMVSGEWTPNYLYAHRLPPLLRSAAPAAKLLVLLRDPVDRYRSDISRRTNRQRQRIVRIRAMARGQYHAALEPWNVVYRPEDILVLQFEACLRAPADELARTYRFLGLDEGFVPANLRTPVNVTASKETLDRDLQHLLVQLYEPDVLALAADHPGLDLRLWPHFAGLA
jgi:hypothetical protein